VKKSTNNVPENSASLWTTYEIQSGDLEGLGFGAGLFVKRDARSGKFISVASFVRTDAAIYYRRRERLSISKIF